MDLYKQFQTDKKAEEEGVWIPLSSTARLKIARMGNPRHQAALKRLSLPYVKPGMRVSDIADDVYAEIAREAAAETILVDWDGITRDQQPVPYSKSDALAALHMSDFYELVLKASSSLETYRVARLAELEKN